MAEELYPDFDHLMLMTVNPGFAGQKLVPQSLTRSPRASAFDDGFAATRLAVDGNAALTMYP